MGNLIQGNKVKKAIVLAHVVHRFNTGGLENGIVNLCNNLDRDKYQPMVCCLRGLGSMTCRLKPHVKVFNLEQSEGIAIGNLGELARLLEEEQTDIVHTHGWGQGSIYGVLGAKMARVPVVINGEHGMFFRKPAQVVAQRLLASLCDVTLSVSRSLALQISANLGIKASKIRTIPNGVDTSIFSGRQETMSLKRDIFSTSEIDIQDADLTVGCIGSLKPHKNQRMLLEALVGLNAKIPDNRCRLLFVGDGPDRGMLEGLVDKHGLRKQVAFLGIRDDVSTVLSLVRALALTSIPECEGMANVVLEAMSSGIPVISTRSIGATELIIHGENGLLIENNDKSALTRALAFFLEDPSSMNMMGKKARDLILSKYSIEKMVYAYDQIYSELLQ